MTETGSNLEPGAVDLKRWFAGDVREDIRVAEEVLAYMDGFGVRSVAMVDRIIGCPLRGRASQHLLRPGGIARARVLLFDAPQAVEPAREATFLHPDAYRSAPRAAGVTERRRSNAEHGASAVDLASTALGCMNPGLSIVTQ